jgi:hypothetical protein
LGDAFLDDDLTKALDAWENSSNIVSFCPQES